MRTNCPYCFPTERRNKSVSHRIPLRKVTCDFQKEGKWVTEINYYLCTGAGSEALIDIYHLSPLSHILYFSHPGPTLARSLLLSWWGDLELQVVWPFVCPVLFGSWLLHFSINHYQWVCKYQERPSGSLGFQTLSPLKPFGGGNTNSLINSIK